MSYNVSTWKTKKIENLVIPLSEFYISERKDWHPTQPILQEDNSFILECGCEQEIKGKLTDGLLEVLGLDMSGEGSGTFMSYVLEHALSKSTGYLEAILIWEGGDSIEKLIVNNGEISREDIEL